MIEEKKGIITDIIFHNEDNGYTIAVMETDDEYFTVVGCLPTCIKGSSYRLTGTFKVHPTYGEQFAFTSFEEVMPTGKAGIEGFLASGVIKGIGPKMAAAIVDVFGDATLEIIEHEPEKLTRVGGIGPKKAEAIAESYAAHREFANVSMHFQQFGISADYALKLYKIYGADAVKLIEENPYRLVKRRHNDFHTIFQQVGIQLFFAAKVLKYGCL